MNDIYLLFAGDIYYPSGGWGDFQGAYETGAEALIAFANGPNWEWAHIIQVSQGVGTKIWEREPSFK